MSKGSKLSFRDRLRYRTLGQRNKYKGEDSWERRDRERRARRRRRERTNALLTVAGFVLIFTLVIVCPVATFKEDDQRCVKAYGQGWDHKYADDMKRGTFCYGPNGEERPVK